MSDDSVLIVGAGFAGIGMAIRLKQAGINDFTVLEQAKQLGGTWRDNTYPGAACDIPSHLYSYSFEPNSSWSHRFAPQEEILAYLERCADKYDVRRHIRFGTTVSSASFDERTGLWNVQTSNAQTFTARVLASGSGLRLSRPVYPDIVGRDEFRGKTMHSARWDHDYPLEGKTVAVIGTGCSAIQIVPSLASTARRLHIFQRTASWLLPKPDRRISPREQAAFRRSPLAQKIARSVAYWILEAFALGYVLFPCLNAIRERHARRYLERSVHDPALRAKLAPKFRLGCKRILVSNDYYAAVQRQNVELVTDPIAAIRQRSIVTSDGTERPIDVIVYATGFDPAEAKLPFAIRGYGGRDLGDVWRDGFEAYLGTTVAGFPNLFLLVGPNLVLGHSSMIFMMEAQFAYVLGAIRMIRNRRLKYVDVRRDVQARYNERLQARLARTVWNTGGCTSWYLTSTGKNTAAWPGFSFEYRLRTRRFDTGSYEACAVPAATRLAPGS